MDFRLVAVLALFSLGVCQVNGVELTGQFGSPLLAKIRDALAEGDGGFPVLQNLYDRSGDSDTPIIDRIKEKGIHSGFPMLRRIAQNFPGMVPALLGAGIQCHNGSVSCGKSITRHVYMGPGAAGLMPTLDSRTMEQRNKEYGPIICAPGAEDCGVSVTYHLYPGDITQSNVGVGRDDRTYIFAAHLSALKTVDVNNQYELKEKYEDQGSFHKSLVNAVCEEAGRKCSIIYDDSNRCYKTGDGSGPRPGTGLLARNYDACIAWAKTPARERMVGFTKPYLRDQTNLGAFYVKEDNPEGFDEFDLSSAQKPIGVINVFAHYAFRGLKRNENLKGSGIDFTRDKIRVVSTRRELWRAIIKGEITAGFAPKPFMEMIRTPGIEQLGEPINCGVNADGSTDVAIMTRKDSSLLQWWDDAFDKIRQNGKFYDICQKHSDEVGGLCVLS